MRAVGARASLLRQVQRRGVRSRTVDIRVAQLCDDVPLDFRNFPDSHRAAALPGARFITKSKRADAPEAPSWADLWNGPPFVVYGHTPRAEIYKRKWSVGIDTACAMGGHLTAFILPEKRFVQVKARRPYFS